MIQRVNPMEEAGWDARVLLHPSTSFFHSTAWARVLSETYGFIPSNFVASQPGARFAVLPMMEVKSPFTGHRGVSLPFTDGIEPLCNDEETFDELFRAAVATGLKRNWRYVEFRGGNRFLQRARPSLSFFGHRLQLGPAIPAIVSQFDPAVRRAIRKAQASELTVEFSRSIEAVREFYSLLSRTRQRHGVPPQPFSFFRAIQKHVLSAEQGWVVLARKGQKAVAGAVFFHFGKTAVYKYGASDESFQNFRGNNLVMVEAIQRYAEEGMESLDFGRTSLRNEGLRRFKLSWGATETQIDYFKYDFRTRDFTLSQDESSGWHNRIFKILPRSVSQVIGTLLYKHIA